MLRGCRDTKQGSTDPVKLRPQSSWPACDAAHLLFVIPILSVQYQHCLLMLRHEE